jgi:hypothetical protein
MKLTYPFLLNAKPQGKPYKLRDRHSMSPRILQCVCVSTLTRYSEKFRKSFEPQPLTNTYSQMSKTNRAPWRLPSPVRDGCARGKFSHAQLTIDLPPGWHGVIQPKHRFDARGPDSACL